MRLVFVKSWNWKSTCLVIGVLVRRIRYFVIGPSESDKKLTRYAAPVSSLSTHSLPVGRVSWVLYRPPPMALQVHALGKSTRPAGLLIARHLASCKVLTSKRGAAAPVQPWIFHPDFLDSLLRREPTDDRCSQSTSRRLDSFEAEDGGQMLKPVLLFTLKRFNLSSSNFWSLIPNPGSTAAACLIRL